MKWEPQRAALVALPNIARRVTRQEAAMPLPIATTFARAILRATHLAPAKRANATGASPFSCTLMNLPVGPTTADHAAPRPTHVVLEGRFGRLRPLEPARDGDRLYALSHGAEAEALWAYLFTGPYERREDFDRHLTTIAAGTHDPVYWAIADRDDHAVGWLSLMRIEPTHRVIEVGSILYTPPMQRTPLATEVQYLLARYVFDTLGYRRYEWKCNDLNAPSRRAALRFGFSYEGTFRQHMLVKHRNRDTAWYAMLDHEWPDRRAAFERWLAPENFDERGEQRASLASLREAAA